jgi:hypothetical protein
MSDCIEWQGSRNQQGYGRRFVEGRNQRVHRLVWIEANGLIPEGMELRHTCDNPSCYNLEHLLLGTRADNMRDRTERGRDPNRIKTHCPFGHEYTQENTYVYNGKRSCKQCKSRRKKEASTTTRNKRGST